MPSFYTDLPPVHVFEGVFDDANFQPVPDDWWAVVLDIQDSTGWIRRGHYRDVNFVGASAIAALRNAATDRDIPFVFGGDGATLLVPETDRERIAGTLLGVVRSARELFSMELHAGMIRVGTLRSEGLDIQVARYQASTHYAQAILRGPGVAEAERRVKKADGAGVYRMDDVAERPPDFTGVECRWSRIDSPRGETVSLLVLADRAEEYRSLFTTLDRIYGTDAERHPTLPGNLRLALNPFKLARYEPKVRRSPGHRTLYTIRIWLQQFLLVLFVRLKLTVGGVEWDRYLPTLSDTSDVRKFDGMLRMVMSGTTAQREQLNAFLQERHAAGHLVWGMHVAGSAIMTCVVFERLGDQVHFVDGSDGGYAMAAADLKRRLETST
ncbi:MAG: DUF3095 domain-containing protein [Rhodothermales bacterium]